MFLIFMFYFCHRDFFQVCREWEAAALKVNKDVRLALIRIGVVLGKDGGALGTMLSLLPPIYNKLAESRRQCCPASAKCESIRDRKHLIFLSAAKMIPLFMMFAGGPLGSGKQWYCPLLFVLVISISR